MVYLMQSKSRLKSKTLNLIKHNEDQIDDIFPEIKINNSMSVKSSNVQSEETVSQIEHLTQAAVFYNSKINESIKARTFLEEHDLLDVRLINTFKIGFSDGSFSEIIGQRDRAILEDKGILNKEGCEIFKDHITIPLYDFNNEVEALYGLNVDNEEIRCTSKTVFFNVKALNVYSECIISRSMIEALQYLKKGFNNTIYFPQINKSVIEILRSRRITYLCIHEQDVELKESLLEYGFSLKIVSHVKSIKECSNEEINLFIENAEIVDIEKSSESLSFKREGVYYIISSRDIEYKISGVKELFLGNLKVSIKASFCDRSFIDTLDLYSSRSRNAFTQNISRMSGVEAVHIERDLHSIIEWFEEMRDKALERNDSVPVKKELTEEEKELGLSFLKDPNMFETIVKDMEILGYVGEDINKKLMYLAASSRILDDPISIIILSQSSAGKSFLAETVRKLMPPEETISVTSLSDQALNYVDDLMHKFLLLGETVHNATVEHQIREMLSGKELSRLVTVKDEKSGMMKSANVKRPVVVSAVMSGTDYGINPENASRCFVISADESREQTRRIHASQREKYSLQRYREKDEKISEIIRTHHAAQRMLKKVRVVNPVASHLNFPDSLMRTRRDNDRFMDLIACVCFLRQYQKEVKEDNGLEYIECDSVDYSIAYEIMVSGVLSTTMRELPESTVEFYEMLRNFSEKKGERTKLKAEENSFTQREIREFSGYGQTWVKKQIKALTDYEYITVIKGGTSRLKGFYRLIENKPLDELNLSIIPTPDEIKDKYSDKLVTSGH